MSYDIAFLRCSDEERTPESVRQRLNEISGREDSAESVETPLTAEQWKAMAAVVADLLALDPYLKSGDSENNRSPGMWISSDDDNCRIPDIDVGYESSSTWFSYSSSSDIFDQIQRVIAVFDRHGYVAYDFQTDDIISPDETEDLGAGFDNTKRRVVTELESRGEIVIKASLSVAVKKKLPWWHFW